MDPSQIDLCLVQEDATCLLCHVRWRQCTSAEPANGSFDPDIFFCVCFNNRDSRMMLLSYVRDALKPKEKEKK